MYLHFRIILIALSASLEYKQWAKLIQIMKKYGIYLKYMVNLDYLIKRQQH